MSSWACENIAAVFSRYKTLPCYVLQHATLFTVMIVMMARVLELSSQMELEKMPKIAHPCGGKSLASFAS